MTSKVFGIAVLARTGSDEEPGILRSYALICPGAEEEAAAHLSRLAGEVLEELDDDGGIELELATPQSLRAVLSDGAATWCAVATDISPLFFLKSTACD